MRSIPCVHNLCPDIPYAYLFPQIDHACSLASCACCKLTPANVATLVHQLPNLVFTCDSADGAGKTGPPLFPLGRPQAAASPGESTFPSFAPSAGRSNTGICMQSTLQSVATLCLLKNLSSWGGLSSMSSQRTHSRHCSELKCAENRLVRYVPSDCKVCWLCSV